MNGWNGLIGPSNEPIPPGRGDFDDRGGWSLIAPNLYKTETFLVGTKEVKFAYYQKKMGTKIVGSDNENSLKVPTGNF